LHFLTASPLYHSLTSHLLSILQFSNFYSPLDFFRPYFGHTLPSSLVSFCRLIFVFVQAPFPHCTIDQNGGLLALEGEFHHCMSCLEQKANMLSVGRDLLHSLFRKDSFNTFDQDHRYSSFPGQSPRQLSPSSCHMDTLPQLCLSCLCDRPPSCCRIRQSRSFRMGWPYWRSDTVSHP
jgi:hypothetical protein